LLGKKQEENQLKKFATNKRHNKIKQQQHLSHMKKNPTTIFL
jgi:hypothetical protein